MKFRLRQLCYNAGDYENFGTYVFRVLVSGERNEPILFLVVINSGDENAIEERSLRRSGISRILLRFGIRIGLGRFDQPELSVRQGDPGSAPVGDRQ